MSKDSIAQAIRDVCGPSDDCYANLTGGLFEGLNRIAKSICGVDENLCLKHDTSLCRSLDGIADATCLKPSDIPGKMTSSRAKWAAEDATQLVVHQLDKDHNLVPVKR
jgi:hypothetical protein